MNKVFSIENPMPPQWMMYPHIHPYSIGWRMGYGEGYKWDFRDWWNTLSKDERERYQANFPEPSIWRGYYAEGKDDYSHHEGFYHEGIDFWRKNGEPKYSLEWLLDQDTYTDFVCFWHCGDINHEPACCFSQWQYSEFEVETSKFSCAEQYMMAAKAKAFEDRATEKEIMETSDPRQMKLLGRKVANFSESTWDKIKYSVVLNGNYYKFAQNKKMREILLSTGDKIIVEASPLDTIWGIGYVANRPEVKDPKYWRGHNLLGFALMEVRDEIMRVYQNYDKIDWEQVEGVTR